MEESPRTKPTTPSTPNTSVTPMKSKLQQTLLNDKELTQQIQQTDAKHLDVQIQHTDARKEVLDKQINNNNSQVTAIGEEEILIEGSLEFTPEKDQSNGEGNSIQSNQSNQFSSNILLFILVLIDHTKDHQDLLNNEYNFGTQSWEKFAKTYKKKTFNQDDETMDLNFEKWLKSQKAVQEVLKKYSVVRIWKDQDHGFDIPKKK